MGSQEGLAALSAREGQWVRWGLPVRSVLAVRSALADPLAREAQSAREGPWVRWGLLVLAVPWGPWGLSALLVRSGRAVPDPLAAP